MHIQTHTTKKGALKSGSDLSKQQKSTLKSSNRLKTKLTWPLARLKRNSNIFCFQEQDSNVNMSSNWINKGNLQPNLTSLSLKNEKEHHCSSKKKKSIITTRRENN
jgi:hypothetical protein